jgi:hypothetical protein
MTRKPMLQVIARLFPTEIRRERGALVEKRGGGEGSSWSMFKYSRTTQSRGTLYAFYRPYAVQNQGTYSDFLTDCSTFFWGGRGVSSTCLCPMQSLATVALQRHNTENSKHVIPGKVFCTASIPIFTVTCR